MLRFKEHEERLLPFLQIQLGSKCVSVSGQSSFEYAFHCILLDAPHYFFISILRIEAMRHMVHFRREHTLHLMAHDASHKELE